MRTSYTLRMYKTDRRRKDGRRHIKDFDYINVTREEVDALASELLKSDYQHGEYTFEVRETYRKVRNYMTDEEYLERFDTPRSCSPSTELYWSM